MKRGVLIAWLFVAVAGCGEDPAGPYEGQRAPSIEGSLMTGGVLDFEKLMGKPTLLVFWASWCGPCRQEAPEIASIARQHGSAINIVGVNAGEAVAVAQRAATEMAIRWPVVMDSDGSIQSLYNVSGIPLVVVLDANGLVRHRNNGMPSNIHRLLDGLMQ